MTRWQRMKAQARARGAMDVLDAGAIQAWLGGVGAHRWAASDPVIAAMFRKAAEIMTADASKPAGIEVVEMIRTTCGDVNVTALRREPEKAAELKVA